LRRTNQTFINSLKEYKPEAILFTVSIFWGLTFPLIKIVLNDVSPNALVFSRFLLTILFFFIFFGKQIKNIKFEGFKHGLILGVFLFIGFLSQTIGLKYTTASKSAFITGINIVLIPFVQFVIIRTKPNFGNIIGVAIVIIGLFFLTEIKYSSINIGDMFTLICAVAFAFHIVFLDKFSRKSGAVSLVFGQYITMFFLSLLSMIIFENILLKDFVFRINNTTILIIIFTAFFSTFLAFYLAIKYQKFVTPVRAGLIYNMEQVSAVISAYFILNEIMNFNQIAGAVFITIGLIISEIFTKFKYERINKGNS
jgi:drug/metabolite transporter (DMT)-like permease